MSGPSFGSFVTLALAAQVLAAPAARAAPRYREVDLSAIAAPGMAPVALARGVLALVGADQDGQALSVLVDVEERAVIRRLDPGERVRALNDRGDVLGFSAATGAAWLLTRGGRLDVPVPLALSVNDRRQVAGAAGGFTPGASLGAVVLDATSGALSRLGTLGGAVSVANAINDAGQVAGSSTTAAGAIHAFRWSDGVMEDLTPGAEVSFGRAIDRRGRVAGSVAVGSELHAMIADGARVLDLGTVPGCSRSEAIAMSERGDVVGDASCDGGSRAFLFTRGALHDLNALAPARDGFVYAQAIAIDARGTIAGIATGPDGFTQRPFVLVRVDDD